MRNTVRKCWFVNISLTIFLLLAKRPRGFLEFDLTIYWEFFCYWLKSPRKFFLLSQKLLSQKYLTSPANSGNVVPFRESIWPSGMLHTNTNIKYPFFNKTPSQKRLLRVFESQWCCDCLSDCLSDYTPIKFSGPIIKALAYNNPQYNH
jgi:hypothetical protein